MESTNRIFSLLDSTSSSYIVHRHARVILNGYWGQKLKISSFVHFNFSNNYCMWFEMILWKWVRECGQTLSPEGILRNVKPQNITKQRFWHSRGYQRCRKWCCHQTDSHNIRSFCMGSTIQLLHELRQIILPFEDPL